MEFNVAALHLISVSNFQIYYLLSITLTKFERTTTKTPEP